MSDAGHEGREAEAGRNGVGGAALRAILALPGNVLGVIPALLLWLGDDAWSLARPSSLRFWAALACFAAGLGLMITTIRLFARVGRGTLAPWAHTQQLVAVGIYRHVRNPMITGVIANLAGEALLFGSRWVAAWGTFFALVNAFYIPLLEEPNLERRFGDSYRRYQANVPRWIPRLRPWEG